MELKHFIYEEDKHMKKIFICVIALLLFAGCSQGEKSSTGNTGATGGGSVSVDVKKKLENKPKFDSKKMLEGLETTAYTWNTKYDNCLALVVKNNSSMDCELNVSVSFKDTDGNLLGVKEDSVNAFGKNGEICFVFDNEEAFASYEYEYSVDELDYYEAVNADLTCEATPAKDKIIVSVTNNGSKIAEWVTATALFMQGDQVVDSSYGYVGDSDSEIKPGNKSTEEIHCFEDFDNVKVYLSGSAEKE